MAETAALLIDFSSASGDEISLTWDESGQDRFRVVCSAGWPGYELRTSGPGLVRLGTRTEEIEEDLVFADADEASLSARPDKILSSSWIGTACGAPNFGADGSVRLPAAAVGLLRVRFRARFDLWRLAGSGPAVVVGIAGEARASLSRTGDESGADGDGSAEPCSIRVTDRCSGDPVPQAQVSLDGTLRGSTGSDGTLDLGEIEPGEHSLQIRKNGFRAHDSVARIGS